MVDCGDGTVYCQKCGHDNCFVADLPCYAVETESRIDLYDERGPLWRIANTGARRPKCGGEEWEAVEPDSARPRRPRRDCADTG
jgi:hypothetical protein